MSKRNQQLVVAIAIFVIALILSYFSTQKEEIVKDADIMLVLDVSGSMDGAKLDDAQESATEFLSAIEQKLHIGLVTFETNVHLNSSLGLDRTSLIGEINQMSEGGDTSMGDAMAEAIDHLVSKGRSDADKYMVLMTDGKSNDDEEYCPYLPLCSPDGKKCATQKAVSNGVIIYTVAFGEDADTDVLGKIAEETGGQYFYAASGSELVNYFVQIAEDISINPGYYYGSRSLMVVAIFLIIFLPAIVKTGKIAVDAMKEKFMKV